MAVRVLMATGAACLLAGCGDRGGTVSSEPVPDDPDATVVAEDMAFDVERVHVPAGEPVTIVIDNRDEGVAHDLHVEGAPRPDRTPLDEGPSRHALTVTLRAGTYPFTCDLHPAMTGELVAS